MRTLSQLESIKGIGPKLKQTLNRNAIYDCFDLIKRFPKRYDVFHIVTLADAPDGERITIEAIVSSVPTVHYIRKNFNRLQFNVSIESRTFTVSIFNRDYLKNILDIGAEIVLTGTLDRIKHAITATTLKLKKNFTSDIEPIYSVDGVGDKQMGKLVVKAMNEYGHLIHDDLPEELLKKYKLIAYQDLLRIIHQPKRMKDLEQITRRIKYEELFKFQLKMQYMRLKNRTKKSDTKHYDLNQVKAFISRLPFELTADQKHATNEIIKDIKSPYVMNRLLQGDVGSGKTVVAAITILAVLSAGYQVAMMAPTDILARQHYKTMTTLFAAEPYRIHLLTGTISASDRNTILTAINQPKPALIIGTHALFSDDVRYHNLGYVITDEQHRFGVNQRQKLREKGFRPDVLYMSATPIPRTLAISLFGDMDISTIREKPAKRKRVETKLFAMDQIDMVHVLMEEELRKHHQIFVVTPLILENETNALNNAQRVFRDVTLRFRDYRVGILHSKIKQDDKEQVMREFENGTIHILVSTTVIEVGVDVANATMMVVFDSDRFGLSQLHQLRGRIGRSSTQSYCLLLHSGMEEIKDRLEVMETTDDGFALSEADLAIRGPGDFFGYRQSGDMKFKRANIVEDAHIMELARQDALELLMKKENYSNPRYEPLFKYLKGVLRKTNLD